MATFTKLICGYIRLKIEKRYQSMPVIPSEVVVICCQYVGTFIEHFAVKGDGMKIVSKYNQPTVTKTNTSGPQCLYGAILIPSSKYSVCEWTFKVNKISDSLGNRSLAIGIVDCADPLIPNASIHFHKRYCAWELHQAKLFTGTRNGRYLGQGAICQAGDVVKMRLDLFPKERKLEFYKGDAYVGTAMVSTNEDIEYRLVVGLSCHMDSIQLMKFEKDLFEFDHGLDWMTL